VTFVVEGVTHNSSLAVRQLNYGNENWNRDAVVRGSDGVVWRNAGPRRRINGGSSDPGTLLVGELRNLQGESPACRTVARREERAGPSSDSHPYARYEADTDVETVRDLISKFGITEPCAVDNEHKLKEAFQNDQGFVPAYYLFDAEGKLKSFAAGERGLDMLKSAIERVLPMVEEQVVV